MGLKVSKKGDFLIVEIDTKEQPILVKSESCRAAMHASRFFRLCVTRYDSNFLSRHLKFQMQNFVVR